MSELADALQSVSRRGRSIALVHGPFELPNPQDLALLKRAACEADVLVVIVQDDHAVRRIAGRGRPVTPLQERLELVRALRWVDHAVGSPEPVPESVLEAIAPEVLVVAPGACAAPGVVRWMQRRGGRIVRVEAPAGDSADAILERVRTTRWNTGS